MADLIHLPQVQNFLAWRGDENTPKVLLIFGVAAVTLSMIINLAATVQTKESLAAWLRLKPEQLSSLLASPGSDLWILPPPPVTIVATVTYREPVPTPMYCVEREPSSSGVAHPAPSSSLPPAPTRPSRSVLRSARPSRPSTHKEEIDYWVKAWVMVSAGSCLLALCRWLGERFGPRLLGFLRAWFAGDQTLPGPVYVSSGKVIIKPPHPGVSYLPPPGPPKIYIKARLPIGWDALVTEAPRRKDRPSASSPGEESASADSPQ